METASSSSRLDSPGLLVGVEAHLAVGVGDRLLHLAGDLGRAVEDEDACPSGELTDLDILRSGCWRSMTRAPAVGMAASGTTRVSPKRWLKRMATSRASSRCWRWSSPDRDPLGVVEDDVGRLEHRVGEQPDPHRLLALALLLELGHPPQFAHGGGALEQPGHLGVLGHVALDEQGAPLGVEPGGQQVEGGVVGPGPQLGRVDVEGEGVEVDHAVEGVVVVLVGRPSCGWPQVVAEVEVAAGLDSGEARVP